MYSHMLFMIIFFMIFGTSLNFESQTLPLLIIYYYSFLYKHYKHVYVYSASAIIFEPKSSVNCENSVLFRYGTVKIRQITHEIRNVVKKLSVII